MRLRIFQAAGPGISYWCWNFVLHSHGINYQFNGCNMQSKGLRVEIYGKGGIVIQTQNEEE
jgi:hypothetical protein